MPRAQAFFTVDQAAARLDVPARWIRRQLATSPAVFFPKSRKIADSWQIAAADLDAQAARRLENHLSARSAAAVLDCSERTIRARIRSGDLPTVLFFGLRRIPESALMQALKHG